MKWSAAQWQAVKLVWMGFNLRSWHMECIIFLELSVRPFLWKWWRSSDWWSSVDCKAARACSHMLQPEYAYPARLSQWFDWHRWNYSNVFLFHLPVSYSAQLVHFWVSVCQQNTNRLGFIISCILHPRDLLHRLFFEAFKNCRFLPLHSEVYPLTVYAFGGWIFEAYEVFTQPWTMLEVTTLITYHISPGLIYFDWI
jgi:hypothetical protein